MACPLALNSAEVRYLQTRLSRSIATVLEPGPRHAAPARISDLTKAAIKAVQSNLFPFQP